MNKLKEKYAPTSQKSKEENKDKFELSDDAYAVCEFIELLMDKLEHVRLTFNKR